MAQEADVTRNGNSADLDGPRGRRLVAAHSPKRLFEDAPDGTVVLT